jgi:NAD(P)-dependent dehydrogenase (short-subunit alcohol dehydrogenase family)
MSKKIALITAADGNDGIAFEAAKQLGKKHGFELIMTSRSISAGTEAVQTLQSEGVTVSLIQLDVADLRSIESAAKTVKEKWGRLDVLVHSAGVGAPSSRTAELQEKGTVFLPTLDTTGQIGSTISVSNQDFHDDLYTRICV